MPAPKRVDGNHRAIVDALRAVGCVVKDVHALPGCLDLLVARAGVLTLLEIKDGAKPKSARKLTEAEIATISELRAVGAPVYVVEDVEGALRAVGL